MNNSQLINQTSDKTEWYTPSYIIELAREVMGDIDLDPASSYAANRTIRADRIFTEVENGLSQSWGGRVWLNHPFSRQYNADWIRYLVIQYSVGNIDEACCITYASTSEKWFRPLLSFPVCFIYGRVNYIDPETGRAAKGVTKGSCVTYLGNNARKFEHVFGRIGSVMFPRGYNV